MATSLAQDQNQGREFVSFPTSIEDKDTKGHPITSPVQIQRETLLVNSSVSSNDAQFIFSFPSDDHIEENTSVDVKTEEGNSHIPSQVLRADHDHSRTEEESNTTSKKKRLTGQNRIKQLKKNRSIIRQVNTGLKHNSVKKSHIFDISSDGAAREGKGTRRKSFSQCEELTSLVRGTLVLTKEEDSAIGKKKTFNRKHMPSIRKYKNSLSKNESPSDEIVKDEKVTEGILSNPASGDLSASMRSSHSVPERGASILNKKRVFIVRKQLKRIRGRQTSTVAKHCAEKNDASFSVFNQGRKEKKGNRSVAFSGELKFSIGAYDAMTEDDNSKGKKMSFISRKHIKRLRRRQTASTSKKKLEIVPTSLEATDETTKLIEGSSTLSEVFTTRNEPAGYTVSDDELIYKRKKIGLIGRKRMKRISGRTQSNDSTRSPIAFKNVNVVSSMTDHVSSESIVATEFKNTLTEEDDIQTKQKGLTRRNYMKRIRRHRPALRFITSLKTDTTSTSISTAGVKNPKFETSKADNTLSSGISDDGSENKNVSQENRRPRPRVASLRKLKFALKNDSNSKSITDQDSGRINVNGENVKKGKDEKTEKVSSPTCEEPVTLSEATYTFSEDENTNCLISSPKRNDFLRGHRKTDLSLSPRSQVSTNEANSSFVSYLERSGDKTDDIVETGFDDNSLRVTTQMIESCSSFESDLTGASSLLSPFASDDEGFESIDDGYKVDYDNNLKRSSKAKQRMRLSSRTKSKYLLHKLLNQNSLQQNPSYNPTRFKHHDVARTVKDVTSLNIDTSIHDISPSTANTDHEEYEASSVTTNSSQSSSSSSSLSTISLDDIKGDFPTYFSSELQNTKSLYLDSRLIEAGITKKVKQNFVSEHLMFLRAVLQLLDERDRIGVKASADDPNTIKVGPLKKKSDLRRGKRLGWKIKYVEIRKGMFSYYENSKDLEGELRRNNIALCANMCACRPVEMEKNGNSGFVFEVKNESGPSRLWMARSNEERAAWIHAINEAMIGSFRLRVDDSMHNSLSPAAASDGRNSLRQQILLGYSEGDNDCKRYKSMRQKLLKAKTNMEYRCALNTLFDDPLSLHVDWIQEEMRKSGDDTQLNSFSQPPHHVTTRDLWKIIRRTSYSINENILHGCSSYGPERIIGGLVRCILEFDKVNGTVNASDGDNSYDSTAKNGSCNVPLTEVQAISYARDILLFSNSSRYSHNSSLLVNHLFPVPNLVYLTPQMPSNENPANVFISHYDSHTGLEDDRLIDGGNEQEKIGWIITRNKNHRGWRRLLCVLSAGVLSYYAKGHPKPHGIKGQFVLVGASLAVSEVVIGSDGATSIDLDNKANAAIRYIIAIMANDGSKERQLCFSDKLEFLSWQEALQKVMDACSPLCTINSTNTNTTTDEQTNSKANKKEIGHTKNKSMGDIFRDAVQRATANSNDPDGLDVLKELKLSNSVPPTKDNKLLPLLRHGKHALEKAVTTPKGLLTNVFRGNEKLATASLMTNGVRTRQQTSSVLVEVQLSTMYSVCIGIPSRADSTNTLGTIRSKSLQRYYLSGGPNGRLLKGKETMQIEFLNDNADTLDHVTCDSNSS